MILFGGLFVLIATVMRFVLLIAAHEMTDWRPGVLAGVLACGVVYDIVTAAYFLIPVVLYLAFLPARVFATRFHRGLTWVFLFAIVYVMLFGAVAEWFFWEEFGVRFNFIAVDYLVYTTEVWGNIRESYPMPAILAALFAVSAGIAFVIYRLGWLNAWLAGRTPWGGRLRWAGAMLFVPLVATFALNNRMVPSFGNRFHQELARNGEYALIAAFRGNELEYDAFYPTLETGAAFARLRRLLHTDDATPVSDDPGTITRAIAGDGDEKRYNVIQITVESLSAEFLDVFGNDKRLTPKLDDIARRGILFTNFRATGTRTDRGMEALVLSVPPTPGRSIVKRPGNENLFTLGSVFRARGYDTAFIYGGYGYFDNMNYFFGNNGYRVIDRTVKPKSAITFANVWGACDEDLLRWVTEEADKAHAAGRPFHHFVMTTSNHRPYTYPEGRIDIPSHTGRAGAVRYTDYAIGKFIADAESHPWFSNTVFVIVADHCASSAGKTDLPVKNYEIPLIIYNPVLFAPQRVDTLCGQIDFAPTLLGLMHWSYESQFFGKDIFRMKPDDRRAFIGTYEMLGCLNPQRIAVLKPPHRQDVYDYDRATGQLSPVAGDRELVVDTIAYYQCAHDLYRRHAGRLHDR